MHTTSSTRAGLTTRLVAAQGQALVILLYKKGSTEAEERFERGGAAHHEGCSNQQVARVAGVRDSAGRHRTIEDKN
eukprot:scaffold295707_cov21-Tisochrysis_lutea.AAC.3